jgi:hypothetical protein
MNRELLVTLLEYAYELHGEWAWKKGERAGNAEEYDELERTIKEAEEVIAKLERKPLTDEQLIESCKDSDPGFHVGAFVQGVKYAEEHHGITTGNR